MNATTLPTFCPRAADTTTLREQLAAYQLRATLGLSSQEATATRIKIRAIQIALQEKETNK